MRAGFDLSYEEIKLQYSHRAGGHSVEYRLDFQEAWEQFITHPDSWKISWWGKSGKLIRITKKGPRLFEFNTVQDIMDDALDQRGNQ